jgi:phospholipid-binding lipoprotein MlaA
MYVRSLTVARRGRHLAVGLSLAIIGCAVPGPSRAQQPAVAQENSGDPLEDANRVVFDFNQTVDRIVLVPVAKTYRTILPSPDRDSVRDFLRNLNEPLVFANDLLQAQPHLAAKTVARFAVNSAVGVGGLIDVATRIDLPHHSNDLGVTFGVWGIGDGPYLMLPVFGPSNVRDLAGQVGESFADPGNIIASNNNLVWVPFVRAGTAAIDKRSRYIENLADIETTSLDYYATIRSLYRQRRTDQLRHEQPDEPNVSPVSAPVHQMVPRL